LRYQPPVACASASTLSTSQLRQYKGQVRKKLSVQTKTAPLHVGEPVTLQFSSPLGKVPEKLLAAEKFTE
jgi:hypothetical protein